MCMSINKSYFSTVGLTVSTSTMTLSEQTDRARQGLTDHTAQSKTSHSKLDRNSTTRCENWRCMSMSSCRWTSCFKGINSDQAHTQSQISYKITVTHPTARTQDISTCRPSSARVYGSSTRGSLLVLLHRSILFTQDACSAVVHICQHNIHLWNA